MRQWQKYPRIKHVRGTYSSMLFQSSSISKGLKLL